jgi:hypothetical protein
MTHRQSAAMTMALALAVTAALSAALPGQGTAQSVDGYVGVSLADMDAQAAAHYGLKGGVVAASVVANGPAWKSGLREGDAVTSVDGHAVSDATTAATLLRAHKAGDTVRMGIIHVMDNGKLFTIELGIVAEPKPANYGNAPLTATGTPGGSLLPLVGARPGGAARATGAMRLVDPQTAMRGTPQRQGNCSALLPQGWMMNSGQYGDTADLTGPEGRAHASWGIRGVNTAMRRFYGPMYGPPDEATLATASTIARAQAQYTSAPKTIAGYFTARSFVAGNVTGVTLNHTYNGPAQGQYILSVFLAWTDRGAANQLPVAEAAMISISCQTQLRPPPPPSAPGRRPGSGAGGEADNLKDYNMQLGTQWAHSSTGTNYLLDYASQWNDNGPDGPGYYIKSGNSYEKLTPGWGG